MAGKPRLIVEQRFLPPTRHARGSDIIFVLPRVPRLRRFTLGYDYAALTGSNFRYADAPQTTLQIPI